MNLPLPNSEGAYAYLASNGWPLGMQKQLVKCLAQVPIRFFIVDNSGSMVNGDGQILSTQGPTSKFIKCSRWTELTNAIRFHAALAEAARAPTEFRLLNDSSPIMLGLGDDNSQRCYTLLSHLDNPPSGGTPLCLHISQIVQQIEIIAPQLRANHQKASVIIATDGESSDGDIAKAMAPLKNLPVWVVLRLCTSENKIVDYWNNIDQELELEMDVLDDLQSEAQQIAEFNKWFIYGEPLHRLREFGTPLKDLDMIDEAALNIDQMCNVVSMILTGSPASEMPNPQLNWKAFETFIRSSLASVPNTWDPLSQKQGPWIKINALVAEYKPNTGNCCTVS